MVHWLIIIGISLFCSAQGSLSSPKKIVIFGAGYVGTVTGACLSKFGHSITFVEPNQDKVDLINEGTSPVFEPLLNDLISDGVEKGLIIAKTNLKELPFDTEMVMICVPTPTTDSGLNHMETLENVLELLTSIVKNRDLIVCIRSTLLPDSFNQLNSHFGQGHLQLAINPEFLRESTAVQDFYHPPFCIAGAENPEVADEILSLFSPFCKKCYSVSPNTACLIKYSCNAFHALKVAFANEMASLCDAIGVNPIELMQIFTQDRTLNCSSAYLKPGFSFGGSCLGKDLRALIGAGKSHGLPLPLLSSILPSNQQRFKESLDRILNGNHRQIAVLGMSFKKNSNDLRDSPYVELIHSLRESGIAVRIYDPDVLPWNSFNALQSLSPWIKDNLESALEGSDGIVLCKDLIDPMTMLKLSSISIYDLGYFLKEMK